ncbi:MAG TPA: nucleotide exchange factor GrpE [Thermoanaerobaculia bacterium]|jgi:molecular chaperone GrpE|nr:nucleotide exchange factor GrpE [Thermoanaerobaculia bacterium]
MADDMRNAGNTLGDTPEVALDLDEQNPDLETAMREAVAAVEDVEAGSRPAVAPASGTGETSETSEITRLRQENAELRDRSVRTLADFDNFRKRSERERQELKRYALLEPMRELLTVADNLDLALSAQGSAEDLKRGVEMIHRQMQELLRRFGLVEVAAVGQPFDPTQHEAVAREESTEVKSPTVVAELRRGYKMHDRLVRPAMVKVAVPAEAGAAPVPAAGTEEGPAL